MIIGGFQPVTLLDYPEKVAAIIFTSGCNMRCPFCYNYKLVLPQYLEKEKSFKEDVVIDFLKKRKKYLDGLVITGGEPTVQQDLPQFLRKMKEIGYEIKLDTNGLLPDKLEALIKEGLVDYVAMDIKGPLDDYNKYCGVEGGQSVRQSISTVMKSGLPYEFRTTLAKGLHTSADIAKIGAEIAGCDLYFLQNFRDEPTLDGEMKISSFTQKEMEEMRQEAESFVKKCLIR